MSAPLQSRIGNDVPLRSGKEELAQETIMNCEQAANLFDAHLDGVLSQSLETELAAHRVKCAMCRQDLALLEVAGHVIASDGAVDDQLEEDFTDRLLACIDGARQQKDTASHPEPSFTINTLRLGGSSRTARLIHAARQLRVSGRIRGVQQVFLSKPWWFGGSSVAAAAVVVLAFKLLLSAPQPAVLGVKFEKESPDPELDLAARSLVTQVETTLSSHAENASSVLHIGEMTILQMLDQLGIGESEATSKALQAPSDPFSESEGRGSEGDEIAEDAGSVAEDAGGEDVEDL